VIDKRTKIRVKKGILYIKNKPVQLEDGEYILIQPRSVQLNDCWKGWVRIIQNEIGYSSFKETEEYLKLELTGEIVETSKLSSEEMSLLLSKLYTFAIQNLNIKLPQHEQKVLHVSS